MRNILSRRFIHAAAIPLALLGSTTVQRTSAQVSLYDFSQSVQTYTEITEADGGYVLGQAQQPPAVPNRAFVDPNYPAGVATPQGYLTPASGPGFPIGFDLDFNGDVFDRIAISQGGWISFGKSSDAFAAVWSYNWNPYPNGDPFIQWFNGPPVPYQRNRVAGFGVTNLYMQDRSGMVPPGPVSTLRMATIGTAPNRVCVVQWKDFGMSSFGLGATPCFINFQIRLNEVDNTVDVRFGEMTWGFLDGRKDVQIGLGGRNNQDFNGRMTVYEEPAFLYDWNSTIPALPMDTTYEVYCHMESPQLGQPSGSGVPPVTGLNFRWSPPACPPPAWPLTVSEITSSSAYATWDGTSGVEFEYYITDTNTITGPELLSGTTTEPEIPMEGLTPMTWHYIFIRGICDGEPGVWSMATAFRTLGGGLVTCDGTSQMETYCSHTNDTIEWHYINADGGALRIDFLDGFVGSVSGETFQIWDGATPTGPADWTAPLASNLAGQTFTGSIANGGQIFMRLITGAGSCETQPWYLPFQWRVGCLDCTPPLVNFALGTEDCEEQEFFVEANVFSLGSAAALAMLDGDGELITTVITTGIHAIGPFPNGTAVVVTAQNTNNDLCSASSTSIINTPCAVVGCGPNTYNYCYSDNEERQWAYQASGAQEIGIRFIRGGMGLGDVARVYNGLDPLNSPFETLTTGGIMNVLFTSGAPSTDHALVLSLVSDDQNSCADAGPIFDASEEWEYVVACYDGCAQPRATFASMCINEDTYEVVVTVTELGSTGSVDITSSTGAPTVTATAVGTYTVGPFQSATPVTIDVVGASVLCTWTSAELILDCADVGLAEQQRGQLILYPNPSNGDFVLELSEALSGNTRIVVLDIAGRVVARQDITARRTQLMLEHLPSGSYTMVAEGADLRTATRLNIQH